MIGLDRKDMNQDEFCQRLREGVDRFSRRGQTDDETWSAFANRLSFISVDFDDAEAYKTLTNQLIVQEKEWDVKANHVFYLATPPSLVETIVKRLGQARLDRDRQRARIVVEKPFGHDLESARALNRMITNVFAESQVYRIDHYLGKDTVQNMLSLNPSGTGVTSTMCRLRLQSGWGWSIAATTMTMPGRYGI